MNIALHICCAPCAIVPIDQLRGEGHVLAGFYYNPNIHPYSEYLRRKEWVDTYAKSVSLHINTAGYSIDDYFQYILHDNRKSERCPACWWLRMLKTAKFAKENGFDAFTTTLLASPYQDHDTLKSICDDVASKCAIGFYYRDFRPGFSACQERAKELGMYRQNYCGCLYSEIEKIEKSGVRGKGQGSRKTRSA